MLSSLCALLLLSAATAQVCKTNPFTVFFKVGNITAQITSDGQLVSSSNGFGVPDDATRMSYALVRRSVTPAVLNLNVVVLHLPSGKRVIIDAGSPNVPAFPDFAAAGQLIANLRASGVTPESIDAVLLTHGHFDHVTGIVNGRGEAAFPNAHIYVTKIEHDFWGSTPFVPSNDNIDDDLAATVSKIYKNSVAPYVQSGRLSVVGDGDSPFEGVSFRLAPGHAPGHAAIRVESAGERLFVTGDIWISQPDQLRHPEWPFVSEHNTTQGFLTRSKLLEELAVSGDLVVPYHEPFPGAGYVVKTAYGHDWVPAPSDVLGTVSWVC